MKPLCLLACLALGGCSALAPLAVEVAARAALCAAGETLACP